MPSIVDSSFSGRGDSARDSLEDSIVELFAVETKTDEGTKISVAGHLLAHFTPDTNVAEIAKFVEVTTKYLVELVPLCKEYEEKREANYAAPYGEGQNYPVFNKLDKWVKRLMKEAGIKDS